MFVQSVLISSFLFASGICITDEKAELTRNYLNAIIQRVNSGDAHWVAGDNFDDVESLNIDHLVGTLEESSVDELAPSPVNTYEPLAQHANVPQYFDGREKWKNCPSISHIWNQGRCSSDWVIAPVSAITDRVCIHSNGSFTDTLSPEAPLACCKSCGFGCKKGYAMMVYKYWTTSGLVTGGGYASKKGCQPYSIKPCHGGRSCTSAKQKTPSCRTSCYNQEYTKAYENDTSIGAQDFQIGCPYCIRGEITKNGPVTATMRVYEDFFHYKSGIYHHVTGKHVGLLTVKLIGYNDIAEPNYWIAANSWGTKWGDKGFFKIVKNQNECDIEGSMRGAWVVPRPK